MTRNVERILKVIELGNGETEDRENMVDENISPWDQNHFGIKKGTKHAIYGWKAYSLGNQKIHVNILETVF